MELWVLNNQHIDSEILGQNECAANFRLTEFKLHFLLFAEYCFVPVYWICCISIVTVLRVLPLQKSLKINNKNAWFDCNNCSEFKHFWVHDLRSSVASSCQAVKSAQSWMPNLSGDWSIWFLFKYLDVFSWHLSNLCCLAQPFDKISLQSPFHLTEHGCFLFHLWKNQRNVSNRLYAHQWFCLIWNLFYSIRIKFSNRLEQL